MSRIDESTRITPAVNARDAIAVIGTGAVMPDAPDAATFFDNVMSGRYSIGEVPEERWNVDAYYDPDPAAPDKTYCRIGAFVRDFAFDFRRFMIPPRTVEAMDPVQQWAMSAAGEALADAGYLDRDFDRERTAVIIGNSMSGELHYATAARVLLPEIIEALEGEPTYRKLPADVRVHLVEGLRSRVAGRLPRVTEDSMPGELSNVITGRVAQAYNLGGASYTVDAACASSLAAIDTAVNGLRRGEYDMALTGGVDRSMAPPTFVKFCKIGALSATGSYPFDARASGFVMGEGCALMVLKRLSDAVNDGDRVLCVILGIGSSSDGKGKGIAAPSCDGQLRALRRAYQTAGVSPADVSVIEAHGTSTRVGDPVEVEALMALYADQVHGQGKVALGSVKSQIGHLKSAAGAAAILKTALGLSRRIILPSVNFESPNPKIPFERTPFRVPVEAEPWPNGRPRTAAVSAFGFGGTNFHVILQQAPDLPASGARTRGAALARDTETKMGNGEIGTTGEAASGSIVDDLLERVYFMDAESVDGLLAALRSGVRPVRLESLADVHAMCAGPCRLAIAASGPEDVEKKVEKLLGAMKDGWSDRRMKVLERSGVNVCAGDPMPVAFLFPGQGSQSVGMLASLHARYAIFRQAFDEADEVMRPILGHGLSDIVYPGEVGEARMAELEERLRQTQITQPAMLAADIAMHRLLGAAGLRADMVAGHSLGEYAALVAAGVLDLGAALEIVAARGREMTSVSLADPGRMVAAMADAQTVERLIARVDGYLTPANKNSSSQTVVAGDSAAVEKLMAVFEAEGIRAVPLKVSHAFHSRIVAPASEPLRRVLSRHEFSPARVPVFTNVGGHAYPENAGAQVFVDVLARQIASPVEFVACVRNMYEAGARLFVEVGPRRVLASFAEDTLADTASPVKVACSNNHRASDLDGLASLWAAAAACGAICATPATPGSGTSHPAGTAGRGNGDPGGDASSTRGFFARSVVVSGTALGLPGLARKLFVDDAHEMLLDGQSLLEPVSVAVQDAFATLNMKRIDRGTGEDLVEVDVTDRSGAIKLAGQVGELDLDGDYGIDSDLVETMDVTARMAVAAGLEALRVAGIPLVQRTRTTTTGAVLPAGWKLPEPLARETGVIFASAFPGLHRFAKELRAYHEHRLAGAGYAFDRKLLFGILAMGHTQLAQAIGACGPNTQVNSACASTTVAVATACDWIRAGRCRRVIVVAADAPSSPELLPFIGGGFLSNGAAATDADPKDAALPFDERRHGLIVGAGACALVLEDMDEVRARGVAPLASIVHTLISNSAYHGSRLDIDHVAAEMERFVAEVEAITGVGRGILAGETIFLSHETYTPARGGSADAEVLALRRTFGDEGASRVLVANTKGFTGHPMGVGFEDALAPWILHTGRVPPIANLSFTDPLFAGMNLSRGGRHDARWVLRFSAGFGSQVAMVMFEKSTKDGRRIVDESLAGCFTEGLLGGRPGRLEVEGRVLHLVADDRAGQTVSDLHREKTKAPPDPARDLLAEIVALVAGKTGYPVDMLDPDMDMEADLGIDTVKQAELFAEIRKTYDIPRQENLRLRDYPTISHVARFVAGFVKPVVQARLAPSALPSLVESVDPRPPAPVPSPVGVPGADLLSEIVALVAGKTGYPVDMLDPDMDMEADLGIDTVKQAELFAEIRKTYDIPRQENLRLRDYPTISHVAGFVARFVKRDIEPPAPEPASTAPRAGVAAADARPSVPPEAVLAMSEPRDARPASPDEAVLDARVLVPHPAWLPPATAFGATGRAMEGHGAPVVLVGTGPVGDHVSTMIAERSVTVLDAASLSSSEGPVAGVIILDEPVPDDLAEAGARVVERAVERFEIIKTLVASGRLDLEKGFVIGATFTGGQLGYGDAGAASPSGGALSGFVKAIGAEFPGSLAKVVDHDPCCDPALAARRILDEVHFDPLTTEVGYSAGQRWGVTLAEGSLPGPVDPSALPRRPVILVTGGAGGIMVHIAERLASKLAARIVLTDVLAADGVSENDPQPAERILGAIERVEMAGGTALYVTADVTDPAAVDLAVEAAIARFGSVDVVLHGAGMEESRGLAKKKTETFRRILAVKVAGAANLARSVLRRTHPRSMLFFSSVAGRFGNAGQADYSAGNDYMTRLASFLSARHPDVRFNAVDWTAWDGAGMAHSSSIRAVLEDAGIQVIDREVGAEIVCRAVCSDSRMPHEVVVARGLGVLEERMARAEGRRVSVRPAAGRSVTGDVQWSGNRLERTFTVDLASASWLQDHAVDGTPVLPAVMGLAEFARTGRALLGGELVPLKIERCAFRRAVKFFGGAPRELRVVLSPLGVKGDRVAACCVLDTENRNAVQGGRVSHFSARILFGRPGGAALSHRPGVMSRGESIDSLRGAYDSQDVDLAGDIYAHLFHGPTFRVMERFGHGGRFGEMGVGDLSSASDLACLGIYALTELGMQTAGMWLLRRQGMAALPASIEAVHVLEEPSTASPHRAVSVYRGSHDTGAEGVHHVFDVTVKDAASSTVLWLESLVLVETGARPEARAVHALPMSPSSRVAAGRS